MSAIRPHDATIHDATKHDATKHDANVRVRPGGDLRGSCRVPGDKSISHRALMLGALAEGPGTVRGFLSAGDTRATLRVMRALGIDIDEAPDGALTIHGRGLDGLRAPNAPLDCANAGTAIRLLAGLLAGQRFASVLDGSAQLRRRPMGRVTAPLRAMGAQIADTDGRAPLHLAGSPLHGMTYDMPVASAQVKSCVLLAGLYADGPTTVVEPGPTRDHTERMLRAMGAAVKSAAGRVTVAPRPHLRPLDGTVPGDLSSAAFVIVTALLAGADEVRINGVGVNPTRTGLLDILAAMGAQVEQANARDESGEPVADLVVRRAALHGTQIDGALVVRAIDEFPALMVAATQAEGVTEVTGAAELRVKETDRLAVMTAELRKLGAAIEERPDGFRIEGPQRLRGATVDGHDDHRVAMALVVAGLAAEGATVVTDARCIDDSFPGFVETLSALGADVELTTGE